MKPPPTRRARSPPTARPFTTSSSTTRFEAGIALVGTEVKSLREGRVNLRDSYAEVRDGEVYLVGAHISPYEQGNVWNHDPLRPRKLLLHSHEIARLQQKINERGFTLVPTRLYFRGSRVKVEVALAHGKKQYDKRADLAKRDAERDVERALRHRDDDR